MAELKAFHLADLLKINVKKENICIVSIWDCKNTNKKELECFSARRSRSLLIMLAYSLLVMIEGLILDNEDSC